MITAILKCKIKRI